MFNCFSLNSLCCHFSFRLCLSCAVSLSFLSFHTLFPLTFLIPDFVFFPLSRSLALIVRCSAFPSCAFFSYHALSHSPQLSPYSFSIPHPHLLFCLFPSLVLPRLSHPTLTSVHSPPSSVLYFYSAYSFSQVKSVQIHLLALRLYAFTPSVDGV